MNQSQLDERPATLYLVHIDPPFTRGRRHYIGYTTKSISERMALHERGTGAAMLRSAVQRGHSLRVVYTRAYETAREAWAREIKIKKAGHYDRICPECKEGEVKDD